MPSEDWMAVTFIEGATWALENQWKRLNEELPQPKKRVLFFDTQGNVHFGYGNVGGEGATLFATDAEKLTKMPVLRYWAEIPQKPTKK